MSDRARRAIATPGAPGAIGPYSQAIEAAGLVWVSGQIPIDPATGELVTGGIDVQTRRVMENLRAVLEAGGSSLARVVRATIYLADLGDFAAVNAVYGEYVPDPPPARACVEVSGLPKGARVEIDAVGLSGRPS